MKLPQSSPVIELTAPADPAPITAKLTAFLLFSAELTLQLDDLQDRWHHLSAPGAGRSSESVIR